MVTTIQLNEDVKKRLEFLKEKKGDTYEKVIVKLIDEKETDKKRIERLIIEGCREMAEDSLKIAKEWEGTLMDGLDKNEKWDF
ncbi:MAG: hypothetical protein QT10_C0001G0040 [archaeon GW2011_AR19]|nr:MAG: hypothetical protein QT10_C0001G0040 [archaeon GW2011_AR19]